MREFIVDHYLFIMIVAAFLIFALIGYIIDSTRNKKKDTRDVLEEENVLLIDDTIPEVQEEIKEIPATSEDIVDITKPIVENKEESIVEPIIENNKEEFTLTDKKEEIIVEPQPEIISQKDNQ